MGKKQPGFPPGTNLLIRKTARLPAGLFLEFCHIRDAILADVLATIVHQVP